jgi:hypothetical protein
MKDTEEYHVILFDSVHHALRSEKILKEMGIPHKLIPVPRHISSDCGICLRFATHLRNRINEALNGRVEIREIRVLE